MTERPTPRTTRLTRVTDLRALRDVVATLACEGNPLDARDRLVVVPTRAAASHLLATIERQSLASAGAIVLPDFITREELIERLSERLDLPRRTLNGAEREALLGAACRTVTAAGHEPPFSIRPGLIAEILRFYDELRMRRNSVDDFERRALYVLEPGAVSDRGAERLVRQTRFLATSFREFERAVREYGLDVHDRRERVATTSAARPVRHVILTVADASFDPHGLLPAEWDVLTRVPLLERLDLVVTDTMLAGAHHERIHQVLPGIEEVRTAGPFDCAQGRPKPARPVLITAAAPTNGQATSERPCPPSMERVHRLRDREEEVAAFARRVKAASRNGTLSAPSRAALVVRRPLPYVYLARDVLRSAGIACQMFDALPLAAEPFAAALDLVLACVSSNFARGPAIALLRSAHFEFLLGPASGAIEEVSGFDGAVIEDVPALDRALAESGYLGDAEALARLIDSWQGAEPTRGRAEQALRAGRVLLGVVRELTPLRLPAPMAEHLDRLIAFMTSHEAPAAFEEQDEPLRARSLRARAAILGTLATLRDAWARFDHTAVDHDIVGSLIRRWVETQTFAPRSGDSGVHVIDAASARLADVDLVHLAGLVDGEWPEPARRNIFYSSSILRELGWPSDVDRLAGERAAFADLLRLAASRLVVSTFTLEADALVSPSSLIDEIDAAGLEEREESLEFTRIFDYEALCLEPMALTHLPLSETRAWATARLNRSDIDDRHRGWTSPHVPAAYAVSAIERYQECPFKFFASDVLRLEEAPEDESTLSPRARGRFIHEVFQRFFEAWDSRGGGAITTERLDDARSLMASIAEPLLARLPPADAALERARLFGSPISIGSADVVFEREVASDAPVLSRRLEYRLEGGFALGSPNRRVALKGVADRIDLLEGRRLRVIDYKTGSAPNPRRALQVAIYALSACERLAESDGHPWAVDEAAYITFTGKRSYVPVLKQGASDDEPLTAARGRLFEAVDAIERGEFPPRPHDPIICTWCAFASVCRKDYVEHE